MKKKKDDLNALRARIDPTWRKEVLDARDPPPRLQKILRKVDLPRYTGLSRSVIDQKVRDGTFPKPVVLNDEGGRAKGWFEDEVAEWQQERLKARDKELQQIGGRDD
jgi:prophage regulatory protein